MSIIGGIMRRRKMRNEAAVSTENTSVTKDVKPMVQCNTKNEAESANVKESIPQCQCNDSKDNAVHACLSCTCNDSKETDAANPDHITDDQHKEPIEESHAVDAKITPEENVNVAENAELAFEEDKKTDEKIETIPLGDEELKSLQSHGYEKNKGKFDKTFVIEKLFWAYLKSTDPVNPGRRQVRVKRVAEIRAASFLHALNMLGWDQKHVSLVGERSNSDGTIAVRMDGKEICRMGVPACFGKNEQGGISFDKLSGGQRKLFIRSVRELAMQQKEVQDAINNSKCIVNDCTYFHGSHINLNTTKVVSADDKNIKHKTKKNKCYSDVQSDVQNKAPYSEDKTAEASA